MNTETGLIGISALLLSAWLTGLARRFALTHGVLDVPNERSSHTTATPRGGGASMVVASSAAWVALTLLGGMRTDLLIALLGGGVAVAAVGFWDDRRAVPAGVRLAVHAAAALWALAWIGGPGGLEFGHRIVELGWAGYLLAALGIVWTLNLFNFMDGIDGIAVSEAVFVAFGGGLLMYVAGTGGGVTAASLVFGAACCGFLRWNWPRAKIFMGDVGSGFLGFAVSVMTLSAARDNPVAVWVWLLLGGVFFVDSTVTLVRRVLRGEPIHVAHRSHAYQWLARRWGSHKRVTVAAVALNVLWLLPCALVATLHPSLAFAVLLIALTPLVVLAIAAGAGRAEDRTP